MCVLEKVDRFQTGHMGPVTVTDLHSDWPNGLTQSGQEAIRLSP
jgi:hypothetical protein